MSLLARTDSAEDACMATYDDTASDWELASIGGFAFARYGGAGIFGFRLRSASLSLNESFFFASSGLGVSGGSGTGATAFAGIWYSYVLNGNSVNPLCPYRENVKDLAQDIADLPGRLDREIRRLHSPF
ncbi:hypothetical protein [Muricoccus radiodurans]|uniref:hypothetical protein n=1 Tax=Muricoccus radiodurans TaxID=2231721 RepID=UPI003CFAFDCD